MDAGREEQSKSKNIKNIHQLYIETVGLCDNTTTKKPLSESDQKWLEEAISTMSVDMADKIKQTWTNIKNHIYNNNNNNEIIESNNDEFKDNIDLMIELTENIDYSKIFFCIGGLEDIIKLIQHVENTNDYPSLNICLNILKSCLANNEYCQDQINKHTHYCEKLLSMTVHYAENPELSDTFYACLDTLSSYVNGSPSNYLQVMAHPSMNCIIESIVPNLMFKQKKLGPKNNLIRFYANIIMMDPVDFTNMFTKNGHFDNLIYLIDYYMNPSTIPNFYLYFEFLITLLERCKENHIYLNMDLIQTLTTKVTLWEGKVPDNDYIHDLCKEILIILKNKLNYIG